MGSNAVLETLRHAWQALEPLDVPMAVMGGIAVSAWEHVRATQDVDILIGVDDRDAARVIDQLAPEGFVPKRSPPWLTLGDVRLLQMNFQPPGSYMQVQFDLLAADSEYHRHALSRRVKTRLPDVDLDLAVLTCEDLILHKLIAGRVIDKVDCMALAAANRATLDIAYLQDWADRLKLRRELEEILAAENSGP